MTAWRRVIELSIGEDDLAGLVSIARSRTEPASRVERARMLLAYREDPSFFAVGQRLGVHHQTVQRCVERALAYGALAALDDRPRPGKEPVITPEAKAWLVSLACDKAKEHGLSARAVDDAAFGPSCARARTGGGSRMSRPSGPGHGVQDTRQRGIKPHKVRYYLERRDAEFEQKMAEVLCVYREVQVLKKAAARSKKSQKRWRSSPTTRSRASRRSRRRRRICRPSPACIATFARDHEYKRHGTLSLLAGIDLLTGKVHALVRGSPSQPRVRRISQASRCRLSGVTPRSS